MRCLPRPVVFVRVLPHPCDLFGVPGSLLKPRSSMLQPSGAGARGCRCGRRLHRCLPLGGFLLCPQTHGMVPALCSLVRITLQPQYPEVWVSGGHQQARMLVSFVTQERSNLDLPPTLGKLTG